MLLFLSHKKGEQFMGSKPNGGAGTGPKGPAGTRPPKTKDSLGPPRNYAAIQSRIAVLEAFLRDEIRDSDY